MKSFSECYKAAIYFKREDLQVVRSYKIRGALLYEGLKHYFIIQFPQRSGDLKEFVVDVLGAKDDIAYFEYTKKHNRSKGPAVVGIELDSSKDFKPLVARMKEKGFLGEYLNEKPELFQFLV